MANVIVTGGAGFIGSKLCEELAIEGHQVLCVDNLQTSSFTNIAPLSAYPNFHFNQWDVELPLNFVESVDRIYNLACPASPIHYQTDPVRTMRTNVLGSINVLELARRTGARVLQASTSEVYGEPEVHPQPEDYRGCVTSFGPRSCYDEGKRAAESLFFDYSRMYGVDIRIARIFNTYGPRMAENDGRVVSTFILQALKGELVTMFGSGTQTRSFCFVSDMVRGLRTLMESEDVVDPCNLGNPEEFTIAELAAMIGDILNCEIKLNFLELPQDDPTRRCPDISKARRHLGWQPKVKLDEGLRRTIPYFDGVLKAKRRSTRLLHSKLLKRAIQEPVMPLGGLGVWPHLHNATPQPGTSLSALSKAIS